jgi:hypothetical protein
MSIVYFSRIAYQYLDSVASAQCSAFTCIRHVALVHTQSMCTEGISRTILCLQCMIAVDTVSQDIAMSKFGATVQSVLKQRGTLKRIWSHREPSCAAI